MSKADDAILYLIRRIQRDPRVAYYFDPITESFEMLTAAYVEKHGGDLKEFREKISANMTFESPAEICNGTS